MKQNQKEKLRKWKQHWLRTKGFVPLLRDKRGFGLNELIGIAACLVIAALIVIPALQSIAGSVTSDLSDWWANISSSIFSLN